MGSKNNTKVHRHYKEFFDKPVRYDVKGYVHAKVPQEHSVYESITPMLNGTRSGFLRPLDNVVGSSAEQGVLDILQRESAARQAAL